MDSDQKSSKSKSKKSLEEKLLEIEVKEHDVNAVRSLVTSLGNVFGMQASLIRNTLRQKGMDIEPTIHYCPETREKKAVILGLKLVFPDKESADYFMACVLRAVGGGE